MTSIRLREVCFARAGDKGESSTVLVAPYVMADFSWLERNLTVEKVRDTFAPLVNGDISRFEMPGSAMLIFAMEGALQGGVSRSLALDPHGKSRANLMLGIVLEVEELPPSVATTPS